MNIVIGADHRGFVYKEYIKDTINIFNNAPINWIDIGTNSLERTDYPIYAQAASKTIKDGSAGLGILLCGSGVGMAIVANRFKGVYAALAWNELIAQDAKEHDGANILVLPADFLTQQQVIAMVLTWLSATFKEGRYKKRLLMIDHSIFP